MPQLRRLRYVFFMQHATLPTTRHTLIYSFSRLRAGEDELIGQFEASLVELTSEKLDTYFFVNPSKIDWFAHHHRHHHHHRRCLVGRAGLANTQASRRIGYRHSGKLKVCYFRPISAQEALEFIEGYHVTLAPLLLAPPPLFPHARMPHGTTFLLYLYMLCALSDWISIHLNMLTNAFGI